MDLRTFFMGILGVDGFFPLEHFGVFTSVDPEDLTGFGDFAFLAFKGDLAFMVFNFSPSTSYSSWETAPWWFSWEIAPSCIS